MDNERNTVEERGRERYIGRESEWRGGSIERKRERERGSGRDRVYRARNKMIEVDRKAVSRAGSRLR